MNEDWELEEDNNSEDLIRAAYWVAEGEWELNFLSSVQKQFDKNGDLSEKQWSIVKRISTVVEPKADELALIERASQAASDEWEVKFIGSIQDQYSRKGALSEKQWVLVERVAGGTEEKPSLDLSGVPSGMYAVPQGSTRLKIQIKHITKGKWAGWTFVSDGAMYGQQKKYGSCKPGGNYQGGIQEQLAAVAADPMVASAAYGHLTSSCGVCGRHLEDEESVARGIGPVCANKF